MSKHATGPTSEAGKERSSRNALKHGLRSERPVLPDEDPAEWDAFRAAIVGDIDPGSAIEAELADRVALQLWRLRRAARYEAEVAAAEIEAARHAATADPLHKLRPELASEQALNDALVRLRDLKNDLMRADAVLKTAQKLASLPKGESVPALVSSDLLGLLGLALTVDLAPLNAADLRREIMQVCNLPMAEALAVASRRAEEGFRDLAERVVECSQRIAFLQQEVAQQSQARQHDSRLLKTTALERVIRYEAHVSRQLNQALQLLRQFKDERRANEEAESRAGSGSDGRPAAPSLPLPAPEDGRPNPSLTFPARPDAGEPSAPRREFVRQSAVGRDDSDDEGSPPHSAPQPSANGRHQEPG
jgi:hypothetical protein